MFAFLRPKRGLSMFEKYPVYYRYVFGTKRGMKESEREKMKKRKRKKNSRPLVRGGGGRRRRNGYCCCCSENHGSPFKHWHVSSVKGAVGKRKKKVIIKIFCYTINRSFRSDCEKKRGRVRRPVYTYVMVYTHVHAAIHCSEQKTKILCTRMTIYNLYIHI